MFNTLCLPSRVRLASGVLVALLAAASASAKVIHYGPGELYRPIYDDASLVFNGDFNLDPLVDPDNPNAANPNVTGWTISPPSEYPGTRNSNAGVGADGRGLRLGDLNLIDVSQVLATTAGQAYQLSFFLAVDGEPGDLFRVSEGTRLLDNLDGVPYPKSGDAWFSQYIYKFVAKSAQTDLVFEYQSPLGDQYLSNVSVLAVPEPMTAALMATGLLAVAGNVRRRRGGS